MANLKKRDLSFNPPDCFERAGCGRSFRCRARKKKIQRQKGSRDKNGHESRRRVLQSHENRMPKQRETHTRTPQKKGSETKNGCAHAKGKRAEEALGAPERVLFFLYLYFIYFYFLRYTGQCLFFRRSGPYVAGRLPIGKRGKKKKESCSDAVHCVVPFLFVMAALENDTDAVCDARHLFLLFWSACLWTSRARKGA